MPVIVETPPSIVVVSTPTLEFQIQTQVGQPGPDGGGGILVSDSPTWTGSHTWNEDATFIADVTANAFIGDGSGLTSLPGVVIGDSPTWTGSHTWDVAATFNDDVTIAGELILGAETVSTPLGTTQLIDLAKKYQTVTLASSTGDTTITLTIPSGAASGSIILKQHGVTPRDVTWTPSSGSVVWAGTEPTWNGDAVNDERIIAWRWDGSKLYLAATEVFA